MRSQIHVGPESGRIESLTEAVVAGGGVVSDPADAEVLVWADPSRAAELARYIEAMPNLAWVALPFAGIEPYVPAIRARTDLMWTCARDVYSRPVAEHAIALATAGLRHIVGYARQSAWSAQSGTMLVDGNVTIVGGGGIAREIISLLHNWNCNITVVKRTLSHVVGATKVMTQDSLLDAVSGADAVILALPLTERTHRIANDRVFGAMQSHSWLVNVARGGVVDHDALVKALRDRQIGGAALDVTDPEPLPADHELWTFPNVIITPHVGNTPEMGVPLLAAFIEANVRSWVREGEIQGVVDPVLGY